MSSKALVFFSRHLISSKPAKIFLHKLFTLPSWAFFFLFFKQGRQAFFCEAIIIAWTIGHCYEFVCLCNRRCFDLKETVSMCLIFHTSLYGHGV